MQPTLPLFPQERVTYPGETVTLQLNPLEGEVAEAAAQGDILLGVILGEPVPEEDAIEITPDVVGTVVRVLAVERTEDGRAAVLVRGTRRFRISALLEDAPFPVALVDWLPEPVGDRAWAAALADGVHDVLAPSKVRGTMEQNVDPVTVSYFLASAVTASLHVKQHLLSVDSAVERLDLERALIEAESGAGLPLA